MGVFRVLLGVDSIGFDSPSRRSRKEMKRLERERKAWYTQAERVVEQNPDQYIPEEPLIESCSSDNVGEITNVTFSRTTKDWYVPFIDHKNPDGSHSSSAIPKPERFDLSEVFYAISAYYAGTPLTELVGEDVPLRLRPSGKWRIDVELMGQEIQAAAQQSSSWSTPDQETRETVMNPESSVQPVEAATKIEDRNQSEKLSTNYYSTLTIKSASAPEEVLEEYDTVLLGLDADADDTREQAYAVMAGLSSTYPDKIAEDIDILFTGLNDETADVRRYALHSLSELAESQPDSVNQGVELIREQLDDTQQKNVAYATEVLALLSDPIEDPSEMKEVVKSILESPEDEVVRTVAVRSAALFAEKYPDEFRDLDDDIIGLLVSDDADIREYACLYYESVGDSSVEPLLRRLLEDDNQSVQQAAERAIDQIADET